MREIGEELKQERLHQNLTLEEVSEKTAFSVAQLTALEEGNLNFFKEDITYVKFFVQNYCKVLKLDFTKYKESFEQSMMTYTHMLTEKEIEAIRKSNEEIRYKVKLQRGTSPNRKKRKIDFSVLSMLAISVIMIIGVFFILSNYVLPNVLDGSPNQTSKTTVLIDDPIETPGSSEVTSVLTLPTLQIDQLSLNEFEVSGFNEGDLIQIGIAFHHRTWIDVSLNGVSFTHPQSKIYQPQDSIVYEFEATSGSIVSMNLGYYDTNVFTINGQPWPMSDSLAKSRSGQVLKLTLKGAS